MLKEMKMKDEGFETAGISHRGSVVKELRICCLH